MTEKGWLLFQYTEIEKWHEMTEAFQTWGRDKGLRN
jgi:hypothetical protein